MIYGISQTKPAEQRVLNFVRFKTGLTQVTGSQYRP
ncbi:hypothetical protein DSTSK_04120 [Desulforhabdus sp. TSK]|nr:hypothetical protein DSTSK_04120 [Desulforhabdus sp. TSK]